MRNKPIKLKDLYTEKDPYKLLHEMLLPDGDSSLLDDDYYGSEYIWCREA